MDTNEGGCEYTFDTIGDFDQFVEDVEWHLANQPDCVQAQCPFDEAMRIHTLPVFGFRGSTKRKYGSTLVKKEEDSDEDEEESMDDGDGKRLKSVIRIL